MENQHHILSIGDATIDKFVKLKDASVLCTLEREKCMLCLSFADKIPIIRLDEKVAGNALNNAVGSARLGLDAALYTVLGSDDTAKKVIDRMEKEKVAGDYVVIQKGTNSNYSVVLNYKGERTILVYHHPRQYVLPKINHPQWIYYTSVWAKGAAKLNRQLVEYVKEKKNFLTFNPGTHQINEGFRSLSRLLKVTDVFFVNKEEAQALIGDHKNIKLLMKDLKRHVPGRIVVTDGSKGSYTYDGEKCYFLPIFKARVVEMTGAGDAYATGFIAALFHGEKAREAMRWGAANSASVIEKIGPQDGLLTLSGMKKRLAENKEIKPQVIFRR
ncbi:carbohydrate kinase family protein [Candidatus Uhrbacteria bacterium]|nr:carbohydrate kinase family protein [Candidatus Uhrbacteria bacterium]